MAELALGALGGCFAGIAALKVKEHLKPQPQVGSAYARAESPKSNRSASRFFTSPVTHLRRDDPPPGNGKRPAVSSNVSLTSSMANLSLLSNFPKALNTKAFVTLLEKLLAESKFLQNNPRLHIVPEEKRAADIVIKELLPYSTQSGGPLIVEELEYVKGRSNLKVTYPGATDKTVAFVGMHFDVVPANPEDWDKDPFHLTQENGKLYGRGTTDCLGHVALMTRFLAELGRTKPKLKRSIVVLFIAGEEGGEKDVGVDVVVAKGKLDEVKGGPVYWIDSADSQPCCGTSGMLTWSVKCKGRLFHSGFPNKGINSIELAAEVVTAIQNRFYDDFPGHPDELNYQFATGSSMKPTQIECTKGSLNQICPETIVTGDIRLSPFYEVEDVVKAIEGYVEDLNQDMEYLPKRGPWSSFVLAPDVPTQPNELRRGKVELVWQGDLETWKLYAGIAVRLDSEGHKALVQAIRETTAAVKPFSISGSLPLVRNMQKAGFDIQLCGFGLMTVYHGVNEYCTLADMGKAHEVLARIVALLESVS